MTDDGAFRVVVAATSDTVRETLLRQGAGGQSGRCLGDLVTSAILIRETMAPSQRLQAILVGGEKGRRVVADSHPDGNNRGLLTLPQGQTEIPLAGATLEVMRTLYSGDLHRGMVEVPPGGVSQAVMSYLSVSEQVASMLSVATLLDDQDRVTFAGGYLVQLLPEVGREPLAVMAERLRDFEDVGPWLERTAGDPGPLLEELLYRMPFTLLEETPVQFGCSCSALRVLSSLATVGRAELTDMIAAREVLDVSCDYCGRAYRVGPEQLRGLLEQS